LSDSVTHSEVGAIAAMCALLLGMRATPIVTRTVRDLDDGGRLLHITNAKTEAGNTQAAR